MTSEIDLTGRKKFHHASDLWNEWLFTHTNDVGDEFDELDLKSAHKDFLTEPFSKCLTFQILNVCMAS